MPKRNNDYTRIFMKKITTLILSASCLFLTSANALTVIDQNGNVHRSETQNPSSNNSYSYQPKHESRTSKAARKDYYNQWGQLEGYSKKEVYSDRTNHYDWLGKSQGYSKKESHTGEVKHYNEWGQYQGSTRDR
jgi:hypothetical protein